MAVLRQQSCQNSLRREHERFPLSGQQKCIVWWFCAESRFGRKKGRVVLSNWSVSTKVHSILWNSSVHVTRRGQLAPFLLKTALGFHSRMVVADHYGPSGSGDWPRNDEAWRLSSFCTTWPGHWIAGSMPVFLPVPSLNTHNRCHELWKQTEVHYCSTRASVEL